MERGNTTHGPWLDELMKEEVRAQVQGGGSGGARVEEWHTAEPPGEDQPEPSLVPGGDRPGGAPAPMTADDVEARSRLGRHVPRSVLPANRADLLRVVQRAQAPDQIVSELRRLPADRRFGTISEVWAALGHPNERRP